MLSLTQTWPPTSYRKSSSAYIAQISQSQISHIFVLLLHSSSRWRSKSSRWQVCNTLQSLKAQRVIVSSWHYSIKWFSRLPSVMHIRQSGQRICNEANWSITIFCALTVWRSGVAHSLQSILPDSSVVQTGSLTMFEQTEHVNVL